MFQKGFKHIFSKHGLNFQDYSGKIFNFVIRGASGHDFKIRKGPKYTWGPSRHSINVVYRHFFLNLNK